MASTQGFRPTTTPVSLAAAVTIEEGTAYFLQNVSGSRRIFFLLGTPDATPDAGTAIAHRLLAGEGRTVRIDAGEALWVWCETDTSCAVALTEAL